VRFSYSNLNASIGLNCAALYAGKIQNKSPIQSENPKLNAIEFAEISHGISQKLKM
jgi:hypothetical protein